MTIKNGIRLYYLLAFMLSAALAGVAVLAHLNHNRMVESQQVGMRSYMLADELRQSSDDLTRFARTFVITGDPRYEAYYHEVLAIRNGEMPLPENYQRIYWDFVVDSGSQHPGGGKASALKQRMAELGFTLEEFAKLAEAAKTSDELSRTEETAINAAKGLYAGKDGKFTRRAAPDNAYATRLLYGDAYHHEKARIMLPINDFLVMIQDRTASATEQFNRRNVLYLRIILVLLAALIVLTGASYLPLNAVAMKPVAALEVQTRELAADIDNFALVVKEISLGSLYRPFSAKARRLGLTIGGEVGGLTRLHDGIIDRLREMSTSVTKIVSELASSNEALKGEDARLHLAEDALKDSEAQLRGVLDSASQVSIIATDLDGKITLFNTGAEKLLGYRADEMVGIRKVADLHLQEELQAHAREYGAVADQPLNGPGIAEVLVRGGAFDKSDMTYVRKDGGYVQVELIVTGVKDHAGKLTGYLGVAMDIGERRRAEAEMRKLRRSVEASPASIVITDKSGNIEYANPKFTEITGYSFAEVLGKNPRILKSGEMPAALYKELWDEITAGREWRGEFHNRKKTGELFWESASISPVKDEAGNIANYVGVKEDITEHKRTVDALRESEERTRLILDSAAEAIYGVDLKGNCTFCNLSCLRMLGYEDASELIGRHMHEAIHHTSKDGVKFPVSDCKVLRSFPKGERAHADDEVLWRRDGTSFPAEYWSYPQFAGGDVVGAVVTFMDITERRRAQQEIETARDAAVKLAQLKSDFLANMSHEIRTPMNAIVGMTGLLQDTALTPVQKDYVSTVNTAGEALLDIINDILDFSKIEAGRLSLEKTDFSVRSLAENMIELVAPKAGDKGIELAFLVDEAVPAAVAGDSGRVRQVLLNLLSNAVKFTDKGEVLLNVILEKETPGRTVLRFSVKDTGIGISREAQQRLFQSFSQADASTTRKYGGTGLGLAISKKLVALMGGEIGVESAPGEGSAFWFTLPFGTASASAAVEQTAGDIEGLRALIVDDNAASRQILLHHLESWKLRCGTAAGGAEALELLKKEAGGPDPFRLALLDMQMPGMDGLALARTMQADPSLSGITRVMLTSLAAQLKPEEAAAGGISKCLAKPVRPAVLLAALRSALGAPQEAAAVKKAGEPSMTLPETLPVRKGFRILVAEDNPVNQKVVLMQLEKAGYKADMAADGLEAMAAVKRFPYDIVLMDCQMPEMDGYQAAAEIRKLEGGTRHTPVVAMTADALEGAREKCLAAGMDDYISKPVRFEALVKMIRKWDRVLDEEYLASLLETAGEDSGVFFGQLVEVYLRDGAERLAAIRRAITGADAPGLAAAAHALKGASANLGVRRMETLCRRLEVLGRSGSVEGALELLDAMEGEFELAGAALAARRGAA